MEFAKRLLLAQEELQSIKLVKDADNPFFKSKYLTLGKLLDTVVPVLNKHGIILSQPLSQISGNPAIMTMLIDADEGITADNNSDLFFSDRSYWYVTPLILAKQDPQAMGSAITYARRYGIMSILGLAADDEDDDGNVATLEEASASSAVL